MTSSLLRRVAVLLLPAPVPARDHFFSWTDIAAWQRLRPEPRPAVDTQTWRELLAPEYLSRLGEGVSIFARQYLYRRLMHGGAGDAGQLGARAMALAADAAASAVLAEQLACLRRAEREVATTLYGESAVESRWMRFLWPLILAVPLGAAGILFTTWSMVLVLAGCVGLMLVQVGLSTRMQAWRELRSSLQLMLQACSRLGDDGRAERLSRLLAEPAGLGLPLVREYCEWFLLSNVRHYRKLQALVAEHRAYLQACHERCAQAEGELALARLLASGMPVCQPVPAGADGWKLEGMVHPLLEYPAPLDVTVVGKGIFLTGQNGVGKSTLLRAVGLNLILARAFGYCHARMAVLPDMPVYASFQNEDSLAAGESLYIAELRRAREMLEAGAGIFLVDEIFRGTNQLESVSAAGAVVRELATRGTVLLSTHNAMLLRVLDDLLAPWCLKRHPGGLELQAGVLVEPNGLALLAERGFSPAIQQQALKIFRELNAA